MYVKYICICAYICCVQRSLRNHLVKILKVRGLVLAWAQTIKLSWSLASIIAEIWIRGMDIYHISSICCEFMVIPNQKLTQSKQNKLICQNSNYLLFHCNNVYSFPFLWLDTGMCFSFFFSFTNNRLHNMMETKRVSSPKMDINDRRRHEKCLLNRDGKW